jgi:hypothetical protein
VHDSRVVVAGHARDKAGGKTENADQTISIDRATVAAPAQMARASRRRARVLRRRLSPRRLRVHLRGRPPTTSGHDQAAIRPARRRRGALPDHLPRSAPLVCDRRAEGRCQPEDSQRVTPTLGSSCRPTPT